MNKAQQKLIARELQRLRNLTIGMTIETWESQKAKNPDGSFVLDENGKHIYDAVTHDRYGFDLPVAVFRKATNIKRHWIVRIKAAYFDPVRKVHEEKWSEFDVPNVRLNDLSDVYHEHRQPTIDMCNHNQFYDIGWWAKALD